MSTYSNNYRNKLESNLNVREKQMRKVKASFSYWEPLDKGVDEKKETGES